MLRAGAKHVREHRACAVRGCGRRAGGGQAPRVSCFILGCRMVAAGTGLLDGSVTGAGRRARLGLVQPCRAAKTARCGKANETNWCSRCAGLDRTGAPAVRRQTAELEAARAELQRRLDEVEKTKASPRPDENLLAQAKPPSVTLESSRDAGSAAQITIPAEAKSILLQIPVEPGNRFQSFSLEVTTRNKAPIESINGARSNRSGSLVVRVSATRLEAGIIASGFTA